MTPTGTRTVVPKHLQPGFFTRLALPMAHAHLDFTMRQVIMNLLGCGTGIKIGGPEKTMIGMEMFLAVASAMQNMDEKPPPPLIVEVLPNGRRVRVLPGPRTALLTREVCDMAGLQPYMPEVHTRLVTLLQLLDLQVCQEHGHVVMVSAFFFSFLRKRHDTGGR